MVTFKAVDSLSKYFDKTLVRPSIEQLATIFRKKKPMYCGRARYIVTWVGPQTYDVTFSKGESNFVHQEIQPTSNFGYIHNGESMYLEARYTEVFPHGAKLAKFKLDPIYEGLKLTPKIYPFFKWEGVTYYLEPTDVFYLLMTEVPDCFLSQFALLSGNTFEAYQALNYYSNGRLFENLTGDIEVLCTTTSYLKEYVYHALRT